MVSQAKWGLLLAIALLLVPAAHAAYSIDVSPITNEIYRNETAAFQIQVQNFNQNDARVQVYTVDPNWNIKTVPLTLLVPAGSRDTLLLYLSPTSAANYGTQGVSVSFKDLQSGDVILKDVILNLRNERLPRREYEPSVALDIRMPYDVNPREQVPLRIEVRNRNSLDIENLTVTISSPHFSRTTSMELGPLSEKTRDVLGIGIDPLTSPGESEVVVKLFRDGELINQLTKNYRIEEYSAIEEDVREESFFFKTTKTVRVMNRGNVRNVALVTVPTSVLKSVFISSSQEYERTVKDEQRVLLWAIPLGPDEVAEFTYIVNYRILILLVILGVGGWIAYLLLRSPVLVVKEVVGITRKGGDGVSQIKVRIFLKNRSAKLIRQLQITDRVPSLAEVIKAEAPGSITPSKIAVSEKQGTLLRWNLEVLEPYEERVLTYQAKSKLRIIGRMSLPQAKARFHVHGKEKAVYSNNIEIIEKFRDK